MRILSILLVLLSFSALVSAQDEAPQTVVETDWTCPEGFEGQTLRVFNWATYIGDHTVADFELLCGVTVLYDVYDSDEIMLARMRQGNPGYDVAFPTDYVVDIMRVEGLLGEIDKANIPNLANIGEQYLGQSFDPENLHSVPYVWGTTGIGYNLETVGYEITSWEQVFECECRVAWLDSPRIMFGAALTVLGYDPNTTNPDEIAEARDFLIANSGNVVSIAADDGDALLAQGEVDIAVEYGGDVGQQIDECECDNLKYVVPAVGGAIDYTSIILLADGPNPALAQVWMDYILEPEIQASITNIIRYPTPNVVAIEEGLVEEAFMQSSGVNIPEEVLEATFFIENVGPETELIINDAWDEVKIMSGL
jgi:spermidine/putrescine transport system substrate-binding protein